MQINKLLTTRNYSKKNNKNRIKYLVIHYVGATGSARNNCEYLKSIYRGTSAHYFVGHEGEIWQCVEDADVAWHCGARKYKHKECRNDNSIGIEMCVRSAHNEWYFEDKTVSSTIELTRELMTKYKIPIENVLRHYDVTGKACPEPYVRNAAAWKDFKNKLVTPSFVPYKVRVTADELNIRNGAGVKYKRNGAITDKGVYTIVEEKMNGKTKWGKLKSGAGWISLSYTKKV